MNRFLICFSAEKPPITKVYKLKKVTEPEDMTVPENTLFFCVVKTNLGTIKDVLETMATIELGNQGAYFSFTKDIIELENKTMYCVGIDKGSLVYNYRINATVHKNSLIGPFKVKAIDL